MLFCEAVRNGPSFVAALAKARQLGKPVIAIKVGRSAAGTRASASHTASLSGSYTAYHAIFERYGVIEAEDTDEAVAIAGVLVSCPLPKGRRVGIVTPSGGGGVWMADMLSALGLIVPPLSAETQAALRPLMPSYGASGNPVDVTAQGSLTGPATMTAMEQLAESDEIDMLVLITSLASVTRISLDAAARARDGGAVRQADDGVDLYAAVANSAARVQRDAGCSCTATCAMSASRWASWRATPRHWLGRSRNRLCSPMWRRCRPTCRVSCRNMPPSTRWRRSCRRRPKRWRPRRPKLRKPLLRLGFPVALKIQSPDLPHKTEAGGVRLGLADAAAVRPAYDAMMRDVLAHMPDARIDGVAVQKMAPKGHELVIGMVNDPTFGPIMMVGFGGVTVELFGDVAHSPAPVDVVEAERMIRSLRSAPLLTGFRGSKPIDLAPVATLIARLSEAALAYADRIAEMEFNPVILHADGSGLTIADALVTLQE